MQSPTKKSEVWLQTAISIAEPICAAHGCELVEIRLVPSKSRSVMRVMIDRLVIGDAEPTTGGVSAFGSMVTLDDCTAVSRDLSTAFDLVESELPPSYSLEVSSPGIERPLVKLSDFQKFSGQRVRIKTHEPIGSRRQFEGPLLGIEGETVRFEQDGQVVEVPHEQIARANLVYKFSS